MNDTASKILQYLAAVLGVHSNAKPWPGMQGLPFFLSDGFDFLEIDLFHHPVVVAIDRRPEALAPSEIAARIRHIASKTGLVIYATQRLTFHNRRALIAQRIPFIVPGTQLYLPDLGIDLREHVRTGHTAQGKTLSPSAQALLIYNLLAKPWNPQLHPAATARELDYTVMTASRAANELVAAGLAHAGHKPKPGAPLYLTLNGSNAKDVWLAAEPVVRSPVTRTVWIDKLPAHLNARVAGASALAAHTMLASTGSPVYAAKRQDWLAAQKADPTLTDLGRDPRRTELQIWSYSPSLAGGDEVDPFSLIASMRDHNDERVQLALNELRENLRW